MPPPQSSPAKAYLLCYNALSAILWLRILLTILSSVFSPNASTSTSEAIYAAIEPQARWTQTLAIIEILHSATGLTRSPIFTTFTQIFARSVQVWVINYLYASTTSSSVLYPAMLFAWSLADTVRYTYFAILQSRFSVPEVLKWLRYSLFTVLYPVGIAGEWWLMFCAIGQTGSALGSMVLWGCLGLYGPGSVMMYSYMLKQRRKTLAK
ncbi:putative membrane protein [Aspergillus stella-maris]|uniref:putative membrane protein n=1 Tax=Aspergillus stella-maris TaxID=1810926 RepID=UPI003CCDD3C6